MNNLEQEIPIFSIESLIHHDPAPEPKEFDLLRLEFLAKEMDHIWAPHRHHFYSLLLITEGYGSHDIDFTNYPLRPNRLFIIAPGQIHAFRQLEQIKGFMILFTDSFITISKSRNQMTSWPIFRLHQTCYLDMTALETARWVEEFPRLEKEALSQDEFSNDALFYSLGNMLIRASRQVRQLSPRKNVAGPDLLFGFQQLIEEKFSEARTPQEYASLLNITPNYLNALCKKRIGVSAGALIRERVVLEAKRLLAHSQLSVAEIGHKLNFDDNSYFGRYFKKYTRMTPDQFRRNNISAFPLL
jgi:AraC family transcriptional regulator, transcriptional activator of pobA